MLNWNGGAGCDHCWWNDNWITTGRSIIAWAVILGLGKNRGDHHGDGKKSCKSFHGFEVKLGTMVRLGFVLIAILTIGSLSLRRLRLGQLLME